MTTAGLAREHNDANVMCLGGRTTGMIEATEALDTFLATAYAGGRHQRRIDEISAYEACTARPAGRVRPSQPPIERYRPTQ